MKVLKNGVADKCNKKIMNTKSNKQSNHKRKKTQGSRTGKKKQKSSINPNHLIQKAKKVEEKPYQAASSYQEMDIHPQIKENLKRMGFVYPTEIQEKTYRKLIEGKNLIGIANTGTGKTAAFLIPIIHQLIEQQKPSAKTLVIVPTRELALQVEQEFKKLSARMSLKSSCHIGGTSINKDIKNLRQQPHLIIGTPGRLIDLMNRKELDLSRFQTLILDEFDRMLDMGFISDIRKIVKAMSNRKQTLLFSATIEPKQQSLINEMVKNPVKVAVSNGTTSSKNVTQDIIRVPNGANKFDLLKALLVEKGFNKVILFAETKRLANKLCKKLNQSGIGADQIHGDKSQNYRVKALDKFKKGNIKVLVATDVAARGVDIDSVTHVINYQLPLNFDTYIHRIGRTGRAGKMGMAYTFVD